MNHVLSFTLGKLSVEKRLPDLTVTVPNLPTRMVIAPDLNPRVAHETEILLQGKTRMIVLVIHQIVANIRVLQSLMNFLLRIMVVAQICLF